MFKSYFTSALRNFLKQKGFTFLNIVGLSLGIAASLLILQYVKYERSYDTFHTKAQDIYRIQYNGWQNGKLRFECAAAVPAVGPALTNNFPEVLRFTRLFPVGGVMSYEHPELGLVSFFEKRMQITDSSVFDIFDFHLIKGNKETVLTGPDKVVISQRAAKKYFGDDDPIGKAITWNGDTRLEVTGVFQDIPDNSHIKFDFMMSYQTLVTRAGEGAETAWGWYDFNTYVLIAPGTDVRALQSKWDTYLYDTRHEDWEKRNQKQEFILQPVLDIHLYGDLLQESVPEEKGDGKAVYALSFIALFILIIAWVNYINLATAKSFDRANEVGVRKVMGAVKNQLIYQFLFESILINFFSALLAVALVWMLWPGFIGLTGRSIPMEYMLQQDFWILLSVLFLVGALLSGFYPAIVLSSFKPIAVLKGKVMRTAHGGLLRKGLVVFQFVASVILIIGLLVVYQQLNFMRNQDLGVNINQTLVLKGPGATDSTYSRKMESFKSEALRVSGVKSMTASTNVPGDEIFWAMGVRRLVGGPESNISGYTIGIDHDYISSFNLKLAAGRSFDRDFTNESQSVILNRAMTEALDFEKPEDALGQKIIQNDTLEVVGVLEDYHQMSLKEAMTPLVFRYTPEFSSFYAFKIGDANAQDVLAGLEEPWKTYFPGNPLDYFFLDEFFNKQYESDRQFGQVFGVFTVLAIFIACLGLFGLASFLTIQRTKEIGIRKVLGSSVPNIVVLLSREFLLLVLIANVIAWPVAWWLMNTWLEGFPYRIEINLVLFVVAAVGVLVVAFLSVGFQTLKAALINPAQTLKYE
ncbi:MAG TPA: ABC transporter permease [Cyclobacteriaceae bacterium]|nr:ABC transporter permease [Cyclobacteriaceae bacterium]